jgi:hypothetical protein
MDESAPRAPALLALKAAQASLAESLTRLRVASTAPPPAPSVGEGESLARGMGVLPGEQGEATPPSLFFPGGLGSGVSSRGRTILPSAATGDSFMVIPGLEDQVTSPLSSAQGEPYDGWYNAAGGAPPGFALWQVQRPTLTKVWGLSRFGGGWFRRRSRFCNQDRGGHRTAQRKHLAALHHASGGGWALPLRPPQSGDQDMWGGHCQGRPGTVP